MSFADRLKTNVRHDKTLKRNVLEITIEQEKEVRIELDPATIARIMHSIGLDIGNQVEGYQIIYGKVCIISAVKGVSLDRFCQRENIIVSKGVVTGTIRREEETSSSQLQELTSTPLTPSSRSTSRNLEESS